MSVRARLKNKKISTSDEGFHGKHLCQWISVANPCGHNGYDLGQLSQKPWQTSIFLTVRVDNSDSDGHQVASQNAASECENEVIMLSSSLSATHVQAAVTGDVATCRNLLAQAPGCS